MGFSGSEVAKVVTGLIGATEDSFDTNKGGVGSFLVIKATAAGLPSFEEGCLAVVNENPDPNPVEVVENAEDGVVVVIVVDGFPNPVVEKENELDDADEGILVEKDDNPPSDPVELPPIPPNPVPETSIFFKTSLDTSILAVTAAGLLPIA